MTNRTIKLSLLFVLVTTAIIFYWILNSKIINPPVETDVILTELITIDLNKKLDKPYYGTKNIGLIKSPSNDEYILSFHRDIEPSTPYYRTNLYLYQLDHNFEPVDQAKLLLHEFHDYKNEFDSTAQDPRLFFANNKFYMLFNDALKSRVRNVYISELEIDKPSRIKSLKHLNFAVDLQRDEKNWTPFVYNSKIQFIYSFEPHIILQWDPKTNILTEEFRNNISLAKDWNLGSIRGGTPAIYVAELDAYLSFFHSSLRYRSKDKILTKRHQPRAMIYYMGAVLFESKPPFRIIAFSKKPLSFPGQYANLDVYHHIIFPCGVIERDTDFVISAGVDDNSAKILSVSKKALYQNLKYIDKYEFAS